MAVKAPAAPTPPTPPSVPGVKLENGGTAQETNVPHDKQQTHDERVEDQARQSVARGDGALSKTTQSKPEKAAKPQKSVDASGGASQENQQPQRVVVPAQNGLNQENPRQEALADAKAQTQKETQTQMAQDNSWGQFASHGAVFWGAVLILMALVVWFGIRKVLMRKQGRKSSLSMADIDGAAVPAAVPGKGAGRAARSREQVETFAELRGLTPDEVLEKLAHDEEKALRAEMRQAREEARARLEKAGRIPVNPSPPPHAARQYREQVTAELPPEKAKTLKPLPKRKQSQDEEQRFEVRI
ncbi:hypothetical protein SELR_03310 [Selenomonas ruminantium subsp. lactilytica TAM6421]|uniref:Uncharacterized protein n=1 Tax=Selenomonas ruminantium subsp. lactilytica (strain NBRC 103574 / TAM6421) TaxID=927704 RepID=I0GMQ2_SELRL|nr:hypothetical protein [Selenomonas ruminantium]BAL82039.1 hypothetical protein SELR_03310 [Selenomonas ruminantium subsp. lactilytica TAM6421]